MNGSDCCAVLFSFVPGASPDSRPSRGGTWVRRGARKRGGLDGACMAGSVSASGPLLTTPVPGSRPPPGTCCRSGTTSHGCGFSLVRAAGTTTWRPGCHLLPGCPGPGPVQVGCGRQRRPVPAAAAAAGTGQRTGRLRRLRTMRHPRDDEGVPEPLAWPWVHHDQRSPQKAAPTSHGRGSFGVRPRPEARGQAAGRSPGCLTRRAGPGRPARRRAPRPRPPVTAPGPRPGRARDVILRALQRLWPVFSG